MKMKLFHVIVCHVLNCSKSKQLCILQLLVIGRVIEIHCHTNRSPSEQALKSYPNPLIIRVKMNHMEKTSFTNEWMTSHCKNQGICSNMGLQIWVIQREEEDGLYIPLNDINGQKNLVKTRFFLTLRISFSGLRASSGTS